MLCRYAARASSSALRVARAPSIIHNAPPALTSMSARLARLANPNFQTSARRHYSSSEAVGSALPASAPTTASGSIDSSESNIGSDASANDAEAASISTEQASTPLESNPSTPFGESSNITTDLSNTETTPASAASTLAESAPSVESLDDTSNVSDPIITEQASTPLESDPSTPSGESSNITTDPSNTETTPSSPEAESSTPGGPSGNSNLSAADLETIMLWPPWEPHYLSKFEQAAYEKHGAAYLPHLPVGKGAALRRVRGRRLLHTILEKEFGEDWYAILKLANKYKNARYAEVNAALIAAKDKKYMSSEEARRQIQIAKDAVTENRTSWLYRGERWKKLLSDSAKEYRAGTVAAVRQEDSGAGSN